MQWRTLVVAALLALSGCSGLPGGEDPASTVTPAPVPTDEPGSGPGSMLAPGLFADGELDSDMLEAAHQEALLNTSFVWEETDNRTAIIGNLTDNSSSYRSVVFENRSTYLFDTNSRTGRDEGRRVFYPVYTEYADGESLYVRALASSWDAYRYDRAEVNGSRNRFVRSTTSAVTRYLAVDSVAVETIESADGLRYRLTANESSSLDQRVRDYRVVAIVTPRGVVEYLSATYEVERSTATGSMNATYRYTSTLTDVGNATVTTPDWLADARSWLANESGDSPP